MIKMVLGDLEWGRRNTTVNKDIRLYDEKIAWLKSLRPQPHWKPSEEQPEVDLEKDIIRYQREDMDRDTTVGDVARHFYELGLKAREKNK